MSRRRNKYYDRKLKLQAVQDYFGGGGSLRTICKKHGIKVYANHHNAICQLQLGIDRAPEDFRNCLQNVDRKAYDKLFLLATQYGVRLTSARGRIYISTAHTESDIDKTLEIFDFIFPMLKK